MNTKLESWRHVTLGQSMLHLAWFMLCENRVDVEVNGAKLEATAQISKRHLALRFEGYFKDPHLMKTVAFPWLTYLPPGKLAQFFLLTRPIDRIYLYGCQQTKGLDCSPLVKFATAIP